jgi:hypothetical protein
MQPANNMKWSNKKKTILLKIQKVPRAWKRWWYWVWTRRHQQNNESKNYKHKSSESKEISSMSIECERMMQRTSVGVRGKGEQAMVWEEGGALKAEKKKKERV